MNKTILIPPPPPSLTSCDDVALLNCTAIVNTSNESLGDKNLVSDSVHRLAGPELKDELVKLKGTTIIMNIKNIFYAFTLFMHLVC